MSFVLGFLGLAVLIWSVVLLRWGGLVAALLILVLAGSCFGHSFFHLGSFTIDRGLLAALLLLYPFAGRLGLAERKPPGATEFCLAAYLVILAGSTLTHDWRSGEGQPLATLVFFYLLPAAVYAVARESKIGERQNRLTIGFFLGFGVYLAVTGMLETLGAENWIWPQYIIGSEYTEFLGRARGPFLNPIACGLFLCTSLAVSLSLWPCRSPARRGILVLVTALVLAGIFCTLTRSVWMAAALITAGFLLSYCPRGRRLAFAAVAGCAVLAAVAASWSSLQTFKRDRDVSAHEMSQSAELRPILAAVAWRMFQVHPLLGCGFGQYERESLAYLHDQNSELPLARARAYVQHNVFLAHLTQTGLLGMAALCLVLSRFGWQAWQVMRCADAPHWARRQGAVSAAVLSAYVINGMFHDVSIMSMSNTLLFLFAGFTEYLARRQAVPRAGGDGIPAEVRAQIPPWAPWGAPPAVGR